MKFSKFQFLSFPTKPQSPTYKTTRGWQHSSAFLAGAGRRPPTSTPFMNPAIITLLGFDLQFKKPEIFSLIIRRVYIPRTIPI
jgi:hypothetical protein